MALDSEAQTDSTETDESTPPKKADDAAQPAPEPEAKAEEPAPAPEPEAKAEEPAPAPEPEAKAAEPAPEPEAKAAEPAPEPEAKAEEPAAEPEAKAEEPAAEPEAKAEEPAAEPEAKAEEPAAEPEAKAEEPAAEPEAKAEEPAAEPEGKAEEPAAGPEAKAEEDKKDGEENKAEDDKKDGEENKAEDDKKDGEEKKAEEDKKDGEENKTEEDKKDEDKKDVDKKDDAEAPRVVEFTGVMKFGAKGGEDPNDLSRVAAGTPIQFSVTVNEATKKFRIQPTGRVVDIVFHDGLGFEESPKETTSYSVVPIGADGKEGEASESKQVSIVPEGEAVSDPIHVDKNDPVEQARANLDKASDDELKKLPNEIDGQDGHDPEARERLVKAASKLDDEKQKKVVDALDPVLKKQASTQQVKLLEEVKENGSPSLKARVAAKVLDVADEQSNKPRDAVTATVKELGDKAKELDKSIRELQTGGEKAGKAIDKVLDNKVVKVGVEIGKLMGESKAGDTGLALQQRNDAAKVLESDPAGTLKSLREQGEKETDESKKERVRQAVRSVLTLPGGTERVKKLYEDLKAKDPEEAQKVAKQVSNALEDEKEKARENHKTGERIVGAFYDGVKATAGKSLDEAEELAKKAKEKGEKLAEKAPAQVKGIVDEKVKKAKEKLDELVNGGRDKRLKELEDLRTGLGLPEADKKSEDKKDDKKDDDKKKDDKKKDDKKGGAKGGKK
jgi:hypothetical protein